MQLDNKQIDELWASQQKQRERMMRARRYYDGESDIMKRNEQYASGTKKTNVPTNWAGYIVNMYVGAMTDAPYQISSETEDRKAVDEYTAIALKADLDSADAENLRNALICGYGLELHEYHDGVPVVLSERPEDWAILRDENDNIVLAVTRFVIGKGGVFRGELLETATEIQYVYDAVSRRAMRRSVQSETAPGGEWTELETTRHFYGAPPVVEVRTNDSRTPLLSDALLRQIDEYEDIDSLSGDDIRNTADAILKLTNVDPEWVRTNSDIITKQRVLPIPEDSDAEYLTRVTDSARITDRLNRSREAIHIMGGVPDVQQIVGVTGGTSGIALQLKFMPMQQRAGAMAKEIKKCIRARIDLLNSMIGKAASVKIENYRVLITFSMPVNRIEEWSNIKGLEGIVSYKTMLELLTDIDDADRELQQVEKEQVTQAEIQAVNQSPDQQAAKQDMQVAKAAPQMDDTIQNAIDVIGDRLLAAIARK